MTELSAGGTVLDKIITMLIGYLVFMLLYNSLIPNLFTM